MVVWLSYGVLSLILGVVLKANIYMYIIVQIFVFISCIFQICCMADLWLLSVLCLLLHLIISLPMQLMYVRLYVYQFVFPIFQLLILLSCCWVELWWCGVLCLLLVSFLYAHIVNVCLIVFRSKFLFIVYCLSCFLAGLGSRLLFG